MIRNASVIEFALIGIASISFLAGCGSGSSNISSSNNPQHLTATVSPSSVAVQVNGVQQFVALVTPVEDNQSVTWAISGTGCSGAGCGVVDATGKYTAPATLPNPATLTVTATSVADSTESAAATVTIVAAPSPGPTAFTPTGNMTVARADHSATLLPDGRVLIAGGISIASAPQPPLASAELYDPSNHSFTLTGNMAVPRNAPGAVLLANGKVLFVGNSLDLRAEFYDPSTGVFTSAGNLISAGTSQQTSNSRLPTLLQDGRVLIEGGNAEIYDPANGMFSLTAAYADANPSWMTSTLLQDGRVLLTGCVSSCSGGATELFDPRTGSFSQTGSMAGWGGVNTATLLMDGTVLFVEANENVTPDDVEVYDPTAGTFTHIGNTSQVHAFSAATRLPDGTVLITGGQLVGGAPSPGSELYLPATRSFTSAGIMTVGRDGHTATLLNDGTVLITGGFSAYPAASATAEIYKPPSVN